MDHDDGLVRSGGQVGDGALSLGAVAVLFVFVPVVGDFVAVPAALAAVGLGLVGFLSEEGTGVGSAWKAVVGGSAGLLCLFTVLITFAAMRT